MASVGPVFLCVLLALAFYDVVGSEESSHKIHARHFGGGGWRGGHEGHHGGHGHWGHGGGGPGGHGHWGHGQGGGWGHHGHGGRGGGGGGGGYFDLFAGFLKMFPMFANIQGGDRQQSINQIMILLKQQPDLLVQIRNYLLSLDATTRNDITVAFQELLKNSGIDISVLLNGGGGGGSGSGSGSGNVNVNVNVPKQVQFDINSIFPNQPEIQAQIQIYLDSLSQDEQQKIFTSLGKLNKDAQVHYLLQISGVSNKRTGGDISVSGGGGGSSGVIINTINLQQLFPNDMNMQSKLQTFFSSLNQETRTKIFYNLGSLDANTQIQILKQLITLSQTPGIITITINGETIKIDNSQNTKVVQI